MTWPTSISSLKSWRVMFVIGDCMPSKNELCCGESSNRNYAGVDIWAPDCVLNALWSVICVMCCSWPEITLNAYEPIIHWGSRMRCHPHPGNAVVGSAERLRSSGAPISVWGAGPEAWLVSWFNLVSCCHSFWLGYLIDHDMQCLAMPCKGLTQWSMCWRTTGIPWTAGMLWSTDALSIMFLAWHQMRDLAGNGL